MSMIVDAVHLKKQQLTPAVHRRAYNAERTRLFILVSAKLGRGASPPISGDMIWSVNVRAAIYFNTRMWRRVSNNQYFPLLYIALVVVFLCATGPVIYAGLS